MDLSRTASLTTEGAFPADVLIVTPAAPAAAKYLPDLADSIVANTALLGGTQVRWRVQVDSEDDWQADAVRQAYPVLRAPWVHVAATGRVRGPAVARNIALFDSLTCLSPSVVVCIDADDVFTGSGLSLLLAPFSDPQVAWCAGGNTWFTDVDGARAAVYGPGGGLSGVVDPGQVRHVWMSEGVFPFAAGTAAYRTDVVSGLGGWPATPTGEDAALLLAASDRYRGFSVPEPVFEYRKHPAQATKSRVHAQLRPLTYEMMIARTK